MYNVMSSQPTYVTDIDLRGNKSIHSSNNLRKHEANLKNCFNEKLCFLKMQIDSLIHKEILLTKKIDPSVKL